MSNLFLNGQLRVFASELHTSPWTRGQESLTSFPFLPLHTHTRTLRKTRPVWRFSCRASAASSQMIPPTHETMIVGANLLVLWCESVCACARACMIKGQVLWENTVSLSVFVHVAESACPDSSSVCMWLQHLYECVTCVMREDPNTCLFVLPYSRLQSPMEVSTKIFYKHSKQPRYVSEVRLFDTFFLLFLSPFFATGNMSLVLC